MPFMIDSVNLPGYIKNKPLRIKQKWIKIFNDIDEQHGEQTAFIVANSWLKRQLQNMFNTKEREEIARTAQAVTRIPLELDTSREVISRTKDGQEYVSFKLADVFKDRYGKQLTPKILKKWADQINSGEVFVGDIDHEAYDQACMEPISDDEFDYKVKNKNGIAKAVRAVFEKGKLWVKAIIDKRYKKQIQKSKGVSMEAVLFEDKDDDNKITDAKLLGFTFGVQHDPIITGTEVYTHGIA